MANNIKEFRVKKFKVNNQEIDVKLNYICYGKLNENKDNLIIFPTRFAGNHNDQDYLIGNNQFLNPEKFFICIPNMLSLIHI